MWASTLCPLSSSTRNIAFGSGSETVPSTSIASFFGIPSFDSRPPHDTRIRDGSGTKRMTPGHPEAERKVYELAARHVHERLARAETAGQAACSSATEVGFASRVTRNLRRPQPNSDTQN